MLLTCIMLLWSHSAVLALPQLALNVSVCTVVRQSDEVLHFHTFLANILYHQSDLGRYDMIVLVHSSAWDLFVSEADKLKHFPGRVTALLEDSIFQHDEKFLIAYEYMLRTNSPHFMYIDSATLLLTSLDSTYSSLANALVSPYWIALPTSDVPKRLSHDYCEVVASILFTDFYYRRAKCRISLHLALVDFSHVSRNDTYREKIDLSDDNGFKYRPGFYLYPASEEIQRRWVTDTSAFTILPCQWSSYEGCPPSASGAMHPQVTPSPVYTNYYSIMSHYRDALLQNSRRGASVCVKAFYRKYMPLFDAEFTSDAPVAALLSLIVPFLYKLPSATLVDVGASVGTFIERIGVMDHFEYHLFEPSPPHYVVLQEKYGNRSNIHITTKALSHSNHTGTQSFFFNPLEATSGRLLSSAMFTQESSGSNISEVAVSVTTLDAYWREVSKTRKNASFSQQLHEITLLKTDTEGYDTLVLLGGQETLKKTGMVIFECHLLEDAEQGGPGTTHYQASKYLEELGFRVFKIGKTSLLEFSGDMYHPLIDIAKGWSNCLALKRGHGLESVIFDKFELNAC